MIRRRKRTTEEKPPPEAPEGSSDRAASVDDYLEARGELQKFVALCPHDVGLAAELEELERVHGGKDDNLELCVTRIRYTGPAPGAGSKKIIEDERVTIFGAEVVRLLSTYCVMAERGRELGEVVAKFERWTLADFRAHLMASLPQ